jgi:hypothetical protein
MKITIDETTKELIIEGTYTIAQLKEYLNLSGTLMDFTIIVIPEPEKCTTLHIKKGIITGISNPPYDGITKSKSFYSADGKIEQNNNVQTATQEEAEAINIATGQKSKIWIKNMTAEAGAMIHKQFQDIINGTNTNPDLENNDTL